MATPLIGDAPLGQQARSLDTNQRRSQREEEAYLAHRLARSRLARQRAQQMYEQETQQSQGAGRLLPHPLDSPLATAAVSGGGVAPMMHGVESRAAMVQQAGHLLQQGLINQQEHAQIIHNIRANTFNFGSAQQQTPQGL